MQRPDALGCLTNWVVKLNEFNIECAPRNTVKGFQTTNNEAEHEVLFVGLVIARSLGVEEIEVRADSKVVVN